MLYSADTIKQFEEFFKKKMYREEDIDYQAWLLYKWDSVGSQEEAFNHVLKKRKPANLVPKKTRQKNSPEGPARYHMNDSAWDPIFRERMDKEKNARKKKNGNKGPAVVASTVTSGALENSEASSSEPSAASELPSRSDIVSVTDDNGNDDSDLPDISDQIVPRPGTRPSLSSHPIISKTKKRKSNNSNNINSRPKRAKVTTTESLDALVSAVPKFPLENGISPLIDDNEDDDNNNDISNLDVRKVIPVSHSTFLDNLDMEILELERLPVSSQASDNSGNNNINNNSRRSLRSRAPSSTATSEGVPKPNSSKASSSDLNDVSQNHLSPGLEQNDLNTEVKKKNTSKLRSKRSSATAMTSVPLVASTFTSSGIPASSLPVSMAIDVFDKVEIKDRMIKNPNPKIKSNPKRKSKEKK